MMILSIIAIVLAVAAIVYGIHVAIVFQRFNYGIKDWALSLDESTRIAIERQARNILEELDKKIEEQKQKEEETNVEPLNEEENE